MEYINYIKARAHTLTASKSDTPVLTEDDEKFLNNVISEENPPPLPARPTAPPLPVVAEVAHKDAQIALLDGAQNIPLPITPAEYTDEPAVVKTNQSISDRFTQSSRATWSWMRRDSRDSKRESTAAGLSEIAQGLKDADAKPNEDGLVDDEEAKKEEEDMVIVLDRLNLAAVNNRVFSISDETQELLQQFNQVFKDLVNGVPTAYRDLESLLSNGDKHLQKTFDTLPEFLQKLIRRLPETMTKGLAPEALMAAAAESSSKGGINMKNAGKAAALASKLGIKTPSLKDLTGTPTAIATMLRSIMTFLRARFPAFMGMNVLWSMALFVLLFVFWYCYKRGREVRLDKEGELTKEEVAALEEEYNATHPNEPLSTTNETGASTGEARGGMEDVEVETQAPTGSHSTAPLSKS